MLDGVEPSVIEEIRHVAEHVPLVRQVLNVRARWIGHRLTAELDLAFDPTLSLQEADKITSEFEAEIFEHVPALASARIRARPFDPAVSGDAKVPINRAAPSAGHLHAPELVSVRGGLADGTLQIIDSPEGERLLFTATRMAPGLEAHVEIRRDGRKETLPLVWNPTDARFTSLAAPEEPHEFDAELHLRAADRTEVVIFRMAEPADDDPRHHSSHGTP